MRETIPESTLDPAPDAMREVLHAAIVDAFRPHLAQVLSTKPEDQHSQFTSAYTASLYLLVDFCLQGYAATGLLGTDFIRALHRALYPAGFKKEVDIQDGTERRVVLLPGEYKSTTNNGCPSVLHPGKTVMFVPPQQVPDAMERTVATLNTALLGAADVPQRCDAIFWFLIDFLAIHPFFDGNGRVACILADLLALRAGLPPFHFHRFFKSSDPLPFSQALELAQQNRDLSLLRDLQAKYGRQTPPCFPPPSCQ